ncbi:type III secretion system export apparatus subunit SctR [Noviherbaspirillum pedocola]|uniref:Type III secretion system export apparatus subunit SctR n=1 Tax=Noviherbaspirillum pedocola TaxID=2801341 RepID=A0A934SQ45_9BURK|nr:type III secretion system export apparatus subunit SctR [Noviherbaspirillum pedocola]MBK4733248.1 type III secretion system export apparatus subunit SctR [Noviherbaspirillum pedocola]
MDKFDPISLAVAFAVFSLVPLTVVVTTSFLKISIVLSLVRNALGVQQAPPNLAIYALSLLLTAYVMAPVGAEASKILSAAAGTEKGLSILVIVESVKKGSEPMRNFMVANSTREQRNFFLDRARQLWPADFSAGATQDDFLIVMPAFVVSELTAAFQIGFLLYMPFVVIDLVISNILMAMGMMMVSPVTISLPLKLFLFVMVDGWSRLIHGLVQTYHLG